MSIYSTEVATTVHVEQEAHILIESQPSALSEENEVLVQVTDANGIVIHEMGVRSDDIIVTPIGGVMDSPENPTKPPRVKNSRALEYEFYYNVEYAKEHNPKLMRIGRTGGFGCTRAAMLKAVKGGDMVRAELRFWELIIETLEETYHEYVIPEGRSLEYFINEWLADVWENPQDPHHAELVAFTRPVNVWNNVITTFKKRKEEGV